MLGNRRFLLWIGTIPLFALAYVLAWGSAPIAVLYWTPAALPLSMATYRRDSELPPIVTVLVGMTWLLIVTSDIGLVFADATFAFVETPLQRIAIAFVLVLVGLGCWRTRRIASKQVVRILS